MQSYGYEIENKKLISEIETKQKNKELELCPFCGNKSVEKIIVNRKGLVIFLFLLMQIPLDEAKKIKKKCLFCGKNVK